ncbi:hypothetical protein L7F22_020735, partial [Adiantum nelumboides]|nr:hypothetical protein [Adiantum nelumboides]
MGINLDKEVSNLGDCVQTSKDNVNMRKPSSCKVLASNAFLQTIAKSFSRNE